jgi:hypothetical protein
MNARNDGECCCCWENTLLLTECCKYPFCQKCQHKWQDEEGRNDCPICKTEVKSKVKYSPESKWLLLFSVIVGLVGFILFSHIETQTAICITEKIVMENQETGDCIMFVKKTNNITKSVYRTAPRHCPNNKRDTFVETFECGLIFSKEITPRAILTSICLFIGCFAYAILMF